MKKQEHEEILNATIKRARVTFYNIALNDFWKEVERWIDENGRSRVPEEVLFNIRIKLTRGTEPHDSSECK